MMDTDSGGWFGSPGPRRSMPAVEAGAHTLEFGERFWVMGVVNVTPDSFSDGGDFFGRMAGIEHAKRLAAEGAELIDIGGESTRPGAEPVPADEEAERVLPIVETAAAETDAVLSIDTRKSAVARRAVELGADIVNDISGLGYDDQMAGVVADTDAALVLMHISGTPETMQREIQYDDVVDDIRAYFEARIDKAVRAGVDEERIVLDPGIGFGKTVEQNYRLIRELEAFFEFGRPLLLGPSRKSCIGAVVDKPPKERVWGTAATVAAGLYAGADIVRVHDVEQMRDVVDVTEAICGMPGAPTE